MAKRFLTPDAGAGFSMIEVLITLVILLLGLLGLAGMLLQSQRSEIESYQRVQALVLLNDMVARINTNRKAASCYSITDAAAGAPYFGNGTTFTPACSAAIAADSTAEQQARAVQDMNDWNDLLQGAAEASGADKAGAMIGARGCVSYDAATLTYLISVAWQGAGSTVAPSGLNCGKNLYGDERARRAVSMTMRIANLQ